MVQRESGFTGDLVEFALIFGDIFSPIEPMIKLHSDLQALGLPTYLFSNTNALAIQHIRRQFSFFELFNGHILSFEHFAMKPGHCGLLIANRSLQIETPRLLEDRCLLTNAREVHFRFETAIRTVAHSWDL